MSFLVDVSLLPGHDPTDFAIETTRWALGPCVVTEGVIAAHREVRSTRRTLVDGIDRYALVLLRRGNFHGECEGRPVSVGPNQPFIIDFARAMDLATDGTTCILVHLSPKSLEDIVPHVTDVHGIVLDGASGALLTEHLVTLVRHLPRLAAGEAIHVGRALCEMIAACMVAAQERGEQVRPRIERALLSKARRYIEDNAHEPDLNHDRICRALGISRSNLYRVFKPQGGVAGYIQRRRLAAIHRLLVAPEEQRRVSAIAAQYGFNNLAHFSRAFRTEFGYAASEVRALSKATALAPARRGEIAGAYHEWVERHDS